MVSDDDFIFILKNIIRAGVLIAPVLAKIDKVPIEDRVDFEVAKEAISALGLAYDRTDTFRRLAWYKCVF